MELPKIDLQSIIDRYNAATFKNTRDFDAFYSDCTHEVYDCWDLIDEIKIEKLSKEEIKSAIDYFEKILPLSTQMLNLLERSDIDTTNYNRFFSQLEYMEEEIPELLKRLKKAQ